jgi:uncharacterized protein (TIGR03545 family)
VELSGASLDLFPVHVELRGLAVTNPNAPMRNAVQAERIAFGLDTGAWILGRTWIDEVAVQGAALDTARETSGALPARKAKTGPGTFERIGAKLELPELTVPSVDEVMDKADLATTANARALAEDSRKAEKRLSQRIAELPGEEQVADYRERLQAIREGKGVSGLVRGGQEAVALKKDINRDLDRIRDFRQDLSQTRGNLKGRLATLRKSPGEDARRLAREYGPNAQGLANVTEAFLGPRVAGWLRQGWYWYGVVRPYLSPRGGDGGEDEGVTVSKPLRDPGMEVHFPREPAEPDTLVRRIAFSAPEGETGEGLSLTGQLSDLTLQPSLWGQPLKADLSGKRGQASARYALEATLDHRRPEKAVDRVDLTVKEAALGGWILAEGTDYPVALERGTGQLAVNGTVAPGGMDLRLDGQVTQAVLKAAGEKKGPVAQALADAMAGVDRFSLQARVTGTPDDPRIALQSSLEKPLRQAVTGVAQQHIAELRKGLESELQKRVASHLEQADSNLSGVAGLDAQAEKRMGSLKDLLGKL